MKAGPTRRWSLRARLVVATSLIFLPMVVVAAAALVSGAGITRATDGLLAMAQERLAPIPRLQVSIAQARVWPEYYLLSGDEQYRGKFAPAAATVTTYFERLLAVPAWPAEAAAHLETARKEWQQAKELAEEILAGGYAVPDFELTHADAIAFAGHVEQALDALERARLVVRQQFDRQALQLAHMRLRAFLTNATLFAAGLIISVLAGLSLARSVLRPLRALEEGVRRIGAGQLSHRVAIRTGDEIERLAKSFNAMAEKLEHSQATLEHLSIHDPLTGLHNYREFRRRLKEESDRGRRYNRPFSLLLLDLDNFKEVNDTHGHQAGDEVLREVADLIRGGVRPVDTVARYGGEELAVILPETPGDKAMAAAERIRRLVARSKLSMGNGATTSLTASIGVAAFGEDAAGEHEIISAADAALYAAKHAGRNRVSRAAKP